MNHFDAVDFSECHSEEVIIFFWRSVYFAKCFIFYYILWNNLFSKVTVIIEGYIFFSFRSTDAFNRWNWLFCCCLFGNEKCTTAETWLSYLCTTLLKHIKHVGATVQKSKFGPEIRKRILRHTDPKIQQGWQGKLWNPSFPFQVTNAANRVDRILRRELFPDIVFFQTNSFLAGERLCYSEQLWILCTNE